MCQTPSMNAALGSSQPYSSSRFAGITEGAPSTVKWMPSRLRATRRCDIWVSRSLTSSAAAVNPPVRLR